MEDEAYSMDITDMPLLDTRRTLHQNVLGKLRPLPFQYHWTVWYDRYSESRSCDDRLYVLHGDVADIATFYRVYNNYPWDRVRLRDTVHIFRKGVKPMWEDPENLKGGCWKFRVPKSKANEFFHEIAILLIANEFQAVLQKGTCVRVASIRLLPASDPPPPVRMSFNTPTMGNDRPRPCSRRFLVSPVQL